MNIPFVNKLSGVGKIVSMRLRQTKPERKLIFGIAGLLGGTILACTKTKQAVDAIEETKSDLRDVKAWVEENHAEGSPAAIKAYTKVYCRFGKKMGKIYAVPALLWGTGMISVVDSHCDLRKENTKLLLDSVAFKKVVDEYRERVAGDVGEEREKQLYFGSREDEIEVIEENPETGAKKVVRKKANILEKSKTGSKFARDFSARTSTEFSLRTYCDYFIEEKVKMLNRRLKSEPFITINEVYDEFGMKAGYGKCKDGLDWGWVWNPNDPDGPNEIIVEKLDGWEELYDERTNKTYWAPCTRLDFNCQPIRDKI